MMMKKILPVVLSLTPTIAMTNRAFADGETMECSDDECSIDYSGAKPLTLVLPKGTKKLNVYFTGSGKLTVKTQGAGDTVDKVYVDCSGSARVDLTKVHAKEAKVKYRGSADLDIHVSERAVIQNSGSGDINISGSPKVEVTGRGSGKVNKDD